VLYLAAMARKVHKPDLGGGVSHPATYSDALYPMFADLLMAWPGHKRVLDPYAGTGGIHRLRRYGYETIGVEIEPEWQSLSPHTVLASALALPFRDGSFDAICTSPTYGNRLADSYNASDPESRHSYRFDLGRPLHADNSGAMKWGHAYREHHAAAWREATRVCKPRARFVLNVKDNLDGGIWHDVAGWHVRELQRIGWEVLAIRPVVTKGRPSGANADKRVDAELVIALARL
jgi:tRNA G10  N-methylase Trm11